MSRARSNRRRRPFDGDLCNCGRWWQLVPRGSTRTFGRFTIGEGRRVDTDEPLPCWHPDEHPGSKAPSVTPEQFIAGTYDRTENYQ